MNTEASKNLLIEQLKKTPIVETACQRVSIGRSTFYYWRREDKEFAKQADEALREGSFLVNDLAESQLIAAIKSGNMQGIVFWLRHNHANYADHLNITARLEKDEALTPEQEILVRRALDLAAMPIDDPPVEAVPAIPLSEVTNEVKQ